MTDREINALCDKVRQTAYEIYLYLRHGHLEKVYENALAHRLIKVGIDARQQHPLNVWDEDGTAIGEYFADLLVERILVVEIKAAKSLAVEHEASTLKSRPISFTFAPFALFAVNSLRFLTQP